MKKTILAFGIVALLSSCGNNQNQQSNERSQEKMEIKLDGSSTVYPVSEAVAEDYKATNQSVNITVGLSGTGGGFKKFERGETDISNASRPITPLEDSTCLAAGINYIELPIAYDGIAIVVNKDNNWLTKITVNELNKLWEPGAQNKIKKWNQVNPAWPDEEVHLFGTGTASGTFDYFTEAINGKSKSIRGDYTAAANPNVLVEGIHGDKNALGFFGLAYFEANKDKLKLIPVDDEKKEDGDGPVIASQETVKNGTYQPLSRPIFIYVSKKSADKPEVKAFVDYYLENAGKLATEVGYIALPDEVYTMVKKRFTDGVTGSAFAGIDPVGVKLDELLKVEQTAK